MLSRGGAFGDAGFDPWNCGSGTELPEGSGRVDGARQALNSAATVSAMANVFSARYS